MCFSWIIRIYIVTVRINAIPPVVNVGWRDLRETRAPWARRESKEILAVPVPRAIEAIKVP